MEIKKSLIICVLFFVLCSLFFVWGVYFPKNAKAVDGVNFLVEKGEGLTEIARNLSEQGIIKSKVLFQTYALLQDVHTKLKAGRYYLLASMNMPEILHKLASGDTNNEKITIIEGWTLRDIAWHFENKGMFQAEEFFENAGFPAIDYAEAQDLPKPKDFSGEFDFLKEKPDRISLEGYLFPDTYEIQEFEEIIKKMLENFDRKIRVELRSEIAVQGRTLFEIITMASLLEKEVKTYEEKQLAAGILWKRLKAGWPLQVDATLTYLTGKDSLNLTKKDLRIASRYNTYKYRGLPLGPICNPGLESIRAAVYYKESPYWFYLTNPEGEAVFSKTLKEHNARRREYLK